MGKTDRRKENRQQLYNSKTNRILERTGRTKAGKGLRTVSLLSAVLMIGITATCVQAIELGGFDVDMGTGSFEEENSGWDQDSGETGSENYDHANDSWNNTENTWNDTMNSTAGNSAQTETDWEDSFSTGPYENEKNDSSYNGSSEEKQMADGQTEDAGIAGSTTLSSKFSGEQLSEEDGSSNLSPTPTVLPTATPVPTPLPTRSISSTPVPEPTQDILAFPYKEEELPDEECRQKMQIIYCKKEIQSASRVKIHPNPQLAAAILSVRINGKEADWHSVGGIIFLNMNEEQEPAKIETAVMCSRELSWTEAKKNAILTYTIF